MIDPADSRCRELITHCPSSTIRLNEPLARYTVARLGGPADALVVAESRAALIEAVQACRDLAVPMRIIGGGANVLFADSGYRGVIIINHCKDLTFTSGGHVQAESGVGLITLARETIARGLSGFEWAIGVPGTIGGGVVNNAGAHGSDMAASIVSVDLIGDNGIETWALDRLGYRYRESALKAAVGQYTVLSAMLHFDSGHDPDELHALAEKYSHHRRSTQPPGASLGSMFKNPPGDYAGRLIEAAGLKGQRIGGVQISPIHANFFVNVGGGTASDYVALIDLAQRTARDQFGIELHLEVELI